jgi:diacylglycerol kinase family enzyme
LARRRPRLRLIVNPIASGVSERAVEEAVRALAERCDVAAARTERRGHAAELAAAAIDDGFDAVAVLAGDGTANEVLNGLHAQLPVGVLPGGGTSVLPRALGLPRSIPDAARQVGEALAAGRTRTISLGTIDGRAFAFAAGVGFDAASVRRVDERGRSGGRRPGDLYFTAQVVRTYLSRSYAQPLLTVEAPGLEPFRGASVVVANTHPWSYVGPRPLQIAPRARFERGLDVVVPRALDLRFAATLLRYALVTGGHAAGRDPRVRYLSDVGELTVRCDRPLPAEADGDDLGDVSEVRLGVEREGARLLV